MSLQNQFNLTILPDDEFLVAYKKIAPRLVFKTTDEVRIFIFDEDARDDISDGITNLFEDELDSDQLNILQELIDNTFQAFSKALLKAFRKHSGNASNPYSAISIQALETIMPHLNNKMSVASAWFAECTFAVRDEGIYDEPPRPNPI